MSFCFNFPLPADESVSTKPNRICAEVECEEPEHIKRVRESPPETQTASESATTDIGPIAAFREHLFSFLDCEIGDNVPAPSTATSTESEPTGTSHPQPDSETVWNAIMVGDTALQFVCPQWLESVLEKEQPASTIRTAAFGKDTNLDIVPKIYEGGFRVWDGACDMLAFLSTERTSEDIRGKKILELGCGAGLPGIFALSKGATVHFHDYNSEVIELATVRNIRRNLQLLNVTLPLAQDSVRLFSGDWTAFAARQEDSSIDVDNSGYDVILTSDTVYRRDVMEKLCSVLPKLLRRDGYALVAGKSHYFGLDGGTDAFRDDLEKRDLLAVTATKEYPDSVRREILTLSWK